MPKLGDKVSFIPSAFMRPSAEMGSRQYPVRVKAEIVYINHAHNWYRAAFDADGKTMYECFKF